MQVRRRASGRGGETTTGRPRSGPRALARWPSGIQRLATWGTLGCSSCNERRPGRCTGRRWADLEGCRAREEKGAESAFRPTTNGDGRSEEARTRVLDEDDERSIAVVVRVRRELDGALGRGAGDRERTLPADGAERLDVGARGLVDTRRRPGGRRDLAARPDLVDRRLALLALTRRRRWRLDALGQRLLVAAIERVVAFLSTERAPRSDASLGPSDWANAPSSSSSLRTTWRALPLRTTGWARRLRLFESEPNDESDDERSCCWARRATCSLNGAECGLA